MIGHHGPSHHADTSTSCPRPEFSKTKSNARSSHPYHNPLAAEPENANDRTSEIFPETTGFAPMIDTVKHAASVAVFFASLAPAFAQAPTDAQRAAIRSACRSDYIAHCSSVPPGGAESLQCLQKNMSSLSASCKTAVDAVPTTTVAPAKTAAPPAAQKADAPAASEPVKPAATAAPAAAPAAPAAAPPAPAATPAPPAAPKPPAAAKKASPASAATTAPPAAPAAAPAMTLRPMRPREQVFVLRSACSADVRTLCAGIAPGGGRIVQCLAANAASLSPACKDVLGRFSASR